MITRRMTQEEHDQGWCAMADGVHAHVWRADVLRKFPQAQGEYCEDCQAFVVRIADLQEQGAIKP